MIQLRIKSMEMAEGSPLVRITLQDTASERELRIWVGWPEAHAIGSQLEGNKPPRPYTHDLMASILSALHIKVLQLLISDMHDDTFFAVLTLADNGRIHEIDCRPSDGIALAVRCSAPIYISEELLTRIEQLDQEREPPSLHPGTVVVEREDPTIH